MSPLPDRPWRPRPRRNLGLATLRDHEQRLERLEALLATRAFFRRQEGGRAADTERPGQAPGRRSEGFTLIELLIVLIVVLILIGLGTRNLADSMRRAAVDQAVAEVLTACDQARQLARLDNGLSDRVYGVRLVDDGRQTTVSLVTLEDGTVAAYAPDGEPLLHVTIPDSVILMEGDSDLRSGSEELQWFYAAGTGETRRLTDGGLSAHACGVGLPRLRLDGVWGLAANSGSVPTIAPGSDGTAGLRLRTTDGRYQVAFGVHESGTAFRRVLDGTETEDLR